MSSRSFVIFQDPSSPVKASKPRPLGRSASAAAVLTSSRLAENSSGASSLQTASTSAEKENTHPLTGLGIGRPLQNKKRKASESVGGVLATKMIAVVASASAEDDSTATGKPAKPKGPQALSRSDLKRKALSDAGSEKTKMKRGPSQSGGSKNINPSTSTTQRGTRSASKLLLEPIKEETATPIEQEDQKTKESIKQVLIDSKCRELTVSPLADVTDAYTQSSESAEGKNDEEETASVAPSEVSLQIVTNNKRLLHFV